MKKIYYSLADYGKSEIKKVNDVLKKDSLTLMNGKNVKTFENKVAKLFGKKFGVMVNSGSSANLLALASLEFVDFVIVNTEAVIEGFTSKNSKVTGTYSGLPASKVVISLPSCGDAASLSAENLKSAANYIMGRGEKPGNYTLSNSYPNFRGFMTWSASHDAKKCNYSYADAFSNTFDSIISRNEISSINSLNIYPNPSEGFISINSEKIIGKKLELIDLGGQIILSTIIKEKLTNIKLENISSGLYTIQVGGYVTKLVVK